MEQKLKKGKQEIPDSQKIDMSSQSYKEKSMKSMRNKRKFKQLKSFTLSEEDKKLLLATDEELKAVVLNSLETKIEEEIKKQEELKKLRDAAATEEEKNKYKKMIKNLHNKITKNRKALNDQKEIKYRLSLLKQKKRKTKRLESTVKEHLESLKKINTRCFKCRRKGHTVAECTFTGDQDNENIEAPENNNNNNEENDKNKEKKTKKLENKANIPNKNICYNCGSNEHTVHGCPKPVDYKNLPFSQCFVCKEMGHLSSKCPKSDKGIYIKGGACYNCGEKDHLAKNCPTRQMSINENENKTNQNKAEDKQRFNSKKNNEVKKFHQEKNLNEDKKFKNKTEFKNNKISNTNKKFDQPKMINKKRKRDDN